MCSYGPLRMDSGCWLSVLHHESIHKYVVILIKGEFIVVGGINYVVKT